MKNELQKFLRAIPSMETLLSLPWVESLTLELGREAVKALFNEALLELRRDARDGKVPLDGDPAKAIEDRARRRISQRAKSSLARLVNATGVVIHTNLGRSPLPPEAIEALTHLSGGYSSLEYSLESGTRGQRNAHVEWLIRQVTGAEAAIVTNNNAGAVLLALSALARGREVVVSSGELVEIGGSFRIPDILAFSGAKMVQVGCTNCTHLRDYRDAIGEETAILLKVHPSNYRIQGFTESVSREDISALARERGVICMEDMGSGLIESLGRSDLGGEPTVRECLAAGVDIVTFSGDKLLGGPQIGCIAGSAALIDRIRGHQLLRALRVDKMTLAAFEVILRMYLKGQSDRIPVVAMIRRSEDELRERAEALSQKLRALLDELSVSSYDVGITETDDAVGGGSFPARSIAGWGVVVTSRAGIGATKLSARLRETGTPIIAGVREDKLVLHVRTLLDGEDEAVLGAFREIFG